MKYNCVSYALKLENLPNLDHVPNLDYFLFADEAVAKFAESFGMECRSIDEHSPLKDGEWEVVFWGFIYEYDPDNYGIMSCVPDYHFARKCEDGIWRHRMCWDAPIEEIDLQEKIDLFKRSGYNPQFFAVKLKEA